MVQNSAADVKYAQLKIGTKYGISKIKSEKTFSFLQTFCSGRKNCLKNRSLE